MSASVGSPENPLRVAIFGSGPSGFYAADHFQKQKNLVVHIDMFDRLPTPFGLVRGGVAPDHAKIKSVTKVYDKIASDPNFRFYGNVEFGRDLTHDDLAKYYHQVIYAVGAQTDRQMGVPGEDLSGSHAATEFVAWYNGHPDYRQCRFDLTQERVAVIGVGNVAMDVARILASSYEELRKTDMADYALEALKKSNVKEIYVIGRRGPAQSAFTNPEIKEIGELEEAEACAYEHEVKLDPLSQKALEANRDSTIEKNIEILMTYAKKQPQGKRKKLYMRFLLSPVEITGNGKVERMKLVRNELFESKDGSLRPRATEQFETLDVGLVFRSIGYKGVPLAGVPFDEKAGIIANQQGRVYDATNGKTVDGEYVVGWIKRGPSGVIGTNKPDSQDTVNLMLEDLTGGKRLNPSQSGREFLERCLQERNINYVTYKDWQILDQIEIEKGKAVDRPRVKICTVPDMLTALKQRKA
jgi:ferredoxin--NADP+ reductase